MYAGNMPANPAQQETKFVYIKMVRAQFNNRYGKLRKGDVLIVPESVAMRWVYAAKIAKPSSQEEYDDFSRRTRRSMQGSRLRNQPLALPAEGESPFEYVEQDSPQWDEMTGDDEGEDPGLNLGDELQNAGNDDEVHDEDFDPDAEQPGVYNARMERGPGEEPEEPSGQSGRGRRARRS